MELNFGRNNQLYFSKVESVIINASEDIEDKSIQIFEEGFRGNGNYTDIHTDRWMLTLKTTESELPYILTTVNGEGKEEIILSSNISALRDYCSDIGVLDIAIQVTNDFRKRAVFSFGSLRCYFKHRITAYTLVS